MESHIQQEPEMTASESGTDRANAARDRALERRRRFLTGGLAAVPVAITTLANRPALAHMNACTPSAALSGNASRPVSGPCGCRPDWWKSDCDSNRAKSWRSQRVQVEPDCALSVHTPTLCGSDGAWSVWPQSCDMYTAICGTAKLKVTLTQGRDSQTYTLNANFLPQVCTGILNARAFGTLYPVGEQWIKNQVVAITLLQTTKSDYYYNKIKTAVDNLTTTLSGYNSG
jgi:hypothetical protein